MGGVVHARDDSVTGAVLASCEKSWPGESASRPPVQLERRRDDGESLSAAACVSGVTNLTRLKAYL